MASAGGPANEIEFRRAAEWGMLIPTDLPGVSRCGHGFGGAVSSSIVLPIQAIFCPVIQAANNCRPATVAGEVILPYDTPGLETRQGGSRGTSRGTFGVAPE